MNISLLTFILLFVLAGFASYSAVAQSKGKDFGRITLPDTLSFDGEIKKALEFDPTYLRENDQHLHKKQIKNKSRKKISTNP